MQALLYTSCSGKKAFPPRSAGPGGFLRLPVGQSLSLWERWHCEAMTERASPSPKSRDTAIGRPFARAMLSPRLPVPASVLALSGADAPALPRGEPFYLHDTAPLRWNKWRSSYKLNDTSLNISCSPTWRSSPDWRSTYFASWAQVRHLGEVRFTALVR